MAVSNNVSSGGPPGTAVWTTDNTLLGATPRNVIREPQDSYVTEKDLEKDVFKIPIERLLNVWSARFGNEWVNLDEIQNDDFFSNAYKRLKQLGELEVHYLTDRARYVCRVPE